jgi:hypothetical protein
LEIFSDFNNELFRRFAVTRNTSLASKKSKIERLKLENKVNSQKCLFYYLKLFCNLFWGPQHFCGSPGPLWGHTTRKKRWFLTISIQCWFGNWSLIGLYFSILALTLKPVDFFFLLLNLITLFLDFRMIFSLLWSLCCISQNILSTRTQLRPCNNR